MGEVDNWRDPANNANGFMEDFMNLEDIVF